MKKIFATVIAFVFVIGLGTAHAAITSINFDTPPDSVDPLVPSFTYGDVTFTNWGRYQTTPTNFVGALVTLGNSTWGTIDFGSSVTNLDFDLQFASAKLYVNDVTESNDLLSGWANPAGPGETWLGTFSQLLTALGISFSEYDNVKFVATSGYVTIDNMTYSPTPIPGAAWLLGSGLIGLVGLRRKFLA